MHQKKMENKDGEKLPNLIELSCTYSEFVDKVNKIYAKFNPVVIVVDFYAKWCGPCRRLLTKIPDMASKFPKVFFIKLNVDQNREIANHFNVRTLPTIKFFGLENDRFTELMHLVGYRPTEIVKTLERMVSVRKSVAKIYSCKYDYDHPPVDDNY